MSQEFLSGSRQYWCNLRTLPIISFLSFSWVDVSRNKTNYFTGSSLKKKCLELFYGVELIGIFTHLRYGPFRTVILLKVCIKHNILVQNLHKDERKWKDAG